MMLSENTPSFLVFSVEQMGNLIKITNNSKYDLFISLLPIKPKRKHLDIFIVKSGGHIIHDLPNNTFDLTKVSFRLIDPNKVANERD